LYQRSSKSFVIFWSLVSQCLNDVRSIDVPETKTRRIELRTYTFTRSDIYVFKNNKDTSKHQRVMLTRCHVHMRFLKVLSYLTAMSANPLHPPYFCKY
jgi:hypothetical protein